MAVVLHIMMVNKLAVSDDRLLFFFLVSEKKTFTRSFK